MARLGSSKLREAILSSFSAFVPRYVRESVPLTVVSLGRRKARVAPKSPLDVQLPPIVVFCSRVPSCHALAKDAVDEVFVSAIRLLGLVLIDGFDLAARLSAGFEGLDVDHADWSVGGGFF